jgi:Leucine-rich repeat (LRR) protein
LQNNLLQSVDVTKMKCARLIYLDFCKLYLIVANNQIKKFSLPKEMSSLRSLSLLKNKLQNLDLSHVQLPELMVLNIGTLDVIKRAID